MSLMHRRLFRLRKKIILAVVALPLLQATGTCDAFSLNETIGTSLASAGFSVFVSSIQSVLLQNFPSADVLQTLLGGNRQPFFQN